MQKTTQTFNQKAQAGIAKSERAFRRLTPAIGAAGKQFLAMAGTAAAVVAIFSGIRFSVNAMIEYEDAVASAMAITGTTTETFKPFAAEIQRIGKETRKSNVDIAKAFEIVGSAKPDLLANADALGAVTESVITLSKASRLELEPAALALTGVMNQFSFEGSEAARVMNVLAAGALEGSANIPNIAASMKNFGTVAASSNITLEQSVALIEILGAKSIFAEDAGTKLKATVLKLKSAGLGFASGQFDINNALAETQKKLDALSSEQKKAAFLQKTFGEGQVTTGQILLDNVATFGDLTKAVTGTNVAQEQAEKNSNTLVNRLDELKNAWVNIITGSDGAGSALDSVKKIIVFVTDNLETIVSTGLKVLKFFALWKAANLIAKVSLAAYNIVLGISNALQGASSIAVGKSSLAIKAYTITTKIAAVAARVMGLAVKAGLGPIGLMITVVGAIIGAIALWTSGTKELTAEQKINNEVQKRAVDASATQRAEVMVLFQQLRNLKSGTEAYTAVLKKIEEISPGITENYNLQAGALENINAAEKELTRNILKRAEVQARAAILQETFEEQIKTQADISQITAGGKTVEDLPIGEAIKLTGLTIKLAELESKTKILGGQVAADEAEKITPQKTFTEQLEAKQEKAQKLGIKINFDNLPPWLQGMVETTTEGGLKLIETTETN